MKKGDIKVGGLYLAKVGDSVTTVRVDSIDYVGDGFRVGGAGRKGRKNTLSYKVTNLSTGKKTVFHSAAKFKGLATPPGPIYGLSTGPMGGLTIDPPITVDPADVAIASVLSAAQEAIETSLPPVEECEEQNPTLVPAPTVEHGSPVVNSADSVPSSVAASSVDSTPSLAGRIRTTMRRRQRGTPVAGMIPNDEQEDILDISEEISESRDCGRVLVICAGAGTGKTATLKMEEQILHGRGQYTAFNKSLVEESRSKFVKASVATTHALAFRAVGKTYQHRLGGNRVHSWQIARMLGIEDFSIILPGQGPPDDDGIPTDGSKILRSNFLAGQVMEAIKRFCSTADREITQSHIFSIALHPFGKDAMAQFKRHLLPFVQKAWEDLRMVDGKLPFAHDVYVKLWQLGEGKDRPVIAADYILLDEAQDTAPVFLDILKQQTHALLILVGDDNQQIYEWRGAVNAMSSFKGAPRRLLSQSYRFGQAIADVANTILATLDEPTDLVMRGNPNLPSRVDVVDEPRCYLYRSNAGAVGQTMEEFSVGRKPHLIGGGADVVAWCQAALDLQAKRGTQHPDLCCFESWSEVKEYSKTDEGADLKLMVKLVDTFGADKIIAALKDMPKEEDSDVVISTAHKSKGREWDTVKLGQDFPTANKMSDSDRRLLYVAATRAKLTLDITECPPFCGGNEREGSETRFVPGLKIVHLQPMPTVEQQEAYMRGMSVGEMRRTDSVVIPPSVSSGSEVEKRMIAEHATKFTWTQYGASWCVRGPINTQLESKVQVEKRNGSTKTVTLRKVVKQYDDAWIYGI